MLAEHQPDSLEFLALPEEIRMCVYYLSPVSEDKISIDEGHNAYHVVNYPNAHASFDSNPTLSIALGAAPGPVS